MKMVIKASIPDPPYSLHDACVSELRAEGETLRLVMQYGYVCTTEPYGQVDGDVLITGIDWESSYVFLMDYPHVLCGNCGTFTGRKMTLKTFLQEYAGNPLELLDECYGYRLVKFSGFLNLPGRLLECSLELYYTGEFRYLLKD